MAGPRLLIVYASQSGGAARLAEAVERGARESSAEVRRLHGTRAGIDDLMWCQALVIVTPENFGYMAGAVKDFFDRTYEPVQGRLANLPFAIVVRAGNDGTFALRAVERIARGYGFKQVADPILSVAGDLDGPVARCEELGQSLAAGLELGIFGRTASGAP